MYKTTFRLVSTKRIISEAVDDISCILKSPNNTTLRIVVIYRPPGSPINDLLDDFCNVLHDYASHPSEVIIAGDFNIHRNQRSRDYQDFMDLLATNGYKQHISVNTHVCGNTLELIITPTSSDLQLSPADTAALISDHFAVECNLRCTKLCTTPNYVPEAEIYRLRSV